MSVAVNKKNLFEKGNKISKGRPKGAYSLLRRRLIELRELAANDAREAYNILWTDLKAGDPLAKQIYFKDLVSVPKEWLCEINTADIPKEIKNVEDINKCLLAIAEKLANADTMSNDEAHSLVKTLNSIKISENMTDQTNTIRETRESLMEKIDKIQKVIDYAKSEKKA